MKIFGVHFSYIQNLEQDENFSEHIVTIENILKFWQMRLLEGRITVNFYIVIHLLLITNSIMIQLIFGIKYRKTSFGKGKKQKLNTLIFAMAMKSDV